MFVKQALMVAAGAAMLSLAFATPSTAVPLTEPPTLTAGGAEYGIFLGTWGPGATCQGEDADCFEDLIASAYPNTPILQDLGDVVDGCPLCNQFSSAGKIEIGDVNEGNDTDNPGTATDLRMTYTVDGDHGTWDYLTLLESGQTPPPGDQPVDLFIVLKYGQFTSIFYYELVDPTLPGSNGLWSLDPATLGLATCAEDEAVNGALCIGANTKSKDGGVPGISHIEAYWPDRQGEVPEPATLAMFGGALMLGGFGLARRRRRQ
jgi:hypothetical protein